ncbi:MAG: hypothetical protein ACRDBO_00400 [Lachnospiraceae bacterium]
MADYSEQKIEYLDSLDTQKYLDLTGNGALENRENLRLVVEYLAACIDAAEATSIELYEHYRKPVNLFRRGVRALARQNWWLEGQVGILDQDVRESLADCILKGCRLQIILQEKYQTAGEHIRDYPGTSEN